MSEANTCNPEAVPEALKALANADLTKAALEYLASGLCVLPAIRAEKRPAVRGKWAPYRTRLPAEAEVRGWLANGQGAICVVCGAVSGNLEMVDFDFAGELFDRWRAKVEAAAPGFPDRLVVGPPSPRDGTWRTAAWPRSAAT